MYLTMLTMTLMTATSGGTTQGAERAVKAFVQAGDRQSVADARAVLHPDFRVLFAMPGKAGATILNKEVYLKMLGDKKIGGKHRTVKLETPVVRGSIAFVKAQLTGGGATFDGLFTLLWDGGAWKLVGDATLFTPPKG